MIILFLHVSPHSDWWELENMLRPASPPFAFNLSGLYFIVSVEAWFATCLKIVDTLGQVLTLSCRAISPSTFKPLFGRLIFANSTNLLCIWIFCMIEASWNHMLAWLVITINPSRPCRSQSNIFAIKADGSEKDRCSIITVAHLFPPAVCPRHWVSAASGCGFSALRRCSRHCS